MFPVILFCKGFAAYNVNQCELFSTVQYKIRMIWAGQYALVPQKRARKVLDHYNGFRQTPELWKQVDNFFDVALLL